MSRIKVQKSENTNDIDDLKQPFFLLFEGKNKVAIMKKIEKIEVLKFILND